jgi:large subunit ribosomal protein L23
MANINDILIKPLLTEKTSLQTELTNRYAFVVNLKANKDQIKNAVEKLFDVKVINVNTNVTPGKLRRAGRKVKKTSSYKKAFVQIEKGQKIEFFKDI